MKYELSKIFDIGELRNLCESFTEINGTVTAILDLEGNVIVATGWQPICTQFHRINDETRKRCNESDIILAGQLEKGKKYNVYKCKNGLLDVAVPIIIEDKHIANFFTGQFFTEKPDKEYFKKQAKQFGFNEKEYLTALDNTPIFGEEQIKKNINFLVKLTETIGNIGLKNVKSIEQANQLKLEQTRLKEINEEFATLNEEYKTLNEELQQNNNELVSAEEEIRASNEELLATSDELKESLNELQKSKEKAEESDRLKTEFIHNMSHEIRTPMNGIIGFSSFIEKENITEEKRKYCINIIQNSGNQLMRIIDDLLEISKLGTKQVKVVERELCLNDLLLEQFSIFDIKAKENKILLYLKKELSDKESTIHSDETKLNKILSNLLENALKYTNEGFIEFGYSLLSTGSDLYLQIYVKDTGIGIKPESQEIIFERFSQEEKGLSRNVGGLGLGLSIAKENAELLGGKITLQSEKGKGSTFFLTIPYKPANSDLKKSTSNNIENNKTENQDKYTILIVEDEEVNYLYIEILLKDEIELNCNILHARHGKEAVEMCQENQEISFVLMDMKMPIMNGFEAAKLIKELRPALPIVAQTAYTTVEDKEKAFSSGCDDFISKPISKGTLNKMINKYLIMKD